MFHLETRDRPLRSCPAVRAHGASITNALNDSSSRRHAWESLTMAIFVQDNYRCFHPPATRAAIRFPLTAGSLSLYLRATGLPAHSITALATRGTDLAAHFGKHNYATQVNTPASLICTSPVQQRRFGVRNAEPLASHELQFECDG